MIEYHCTPLASLFPPVSEGIVYHEVVVVVTMATVETVATVVVVMVLVVVKVMESVPHCPVSQPCSPTCAYMCMCILSHNLLILNI